MQKSASTRQTQPSTSIQTPHIFWKQKLAAARVGIFHGVDAQGRRTHLFKWRCSCQHSYIKICCRLHRQSGTQSTVPQLPNRIIFCLTLTNMGHLQPKTHVHCNNAMVVGIANNTIKRQPSCSMEKHFFWIRDKVAQEMYTLNWHPGLENLANYQSKHHAGSHHIEVRPWYLHSKNPPGYYLGRRDLVHWKGV